MIRSASFGNSGAPPAKQPFSFGGHSSSSTTTTTNPPQQQQQQQQQPGTMGTFSFGGGGGSNAGVGAGADTSSSGANNGASQSIPTFSFGGPASQPQPQQQQQQQQQPSSTFSFGASSSTQPQQQSGGSTSLFGSSSAAKPGGFSFAQSTAAPPPAPGGLFGSAQPAANTGNTALVGSLFGGGGGGGAAAAAPFASSGIGSQQQQQSGSALLSHPFYQKERFNDLSDEARRLVEEMDKLISSQVSIRDELTPKLIPSSSSGSESSSLAPLGQKISALYSTLHEASLGLDSLSSSLERELASVKSLSSSVQVDRGDLGVLWEIGAGFRDGRGAGDNRRDWIRDYFTNAAEDFRRRILRYRASMEQVQRHLSSLSSRDAHSPQAISDTLYFQHSTFMSLAAHVASLHAEVEVLRRDYRAWYAQQFRSVRDPFEFSGEEETGAGGGGAIFV